MLHSCKLSTELLYSWETEPQHGGACANLGDNHLIPWIRIRLPCGVTKRAWQTHNSHRKYSWPLQTRVAPVCHALGTGTLTFKGEGGRKYNRSWHIQINELKLSLHNFSVVQFQRVMMNSWLCICGFGEAGSWTFGFLFESDGDLLSDLLNVSSWLLLMLYSA